jgi:hypothetical protein
MEIDNILRLHSEQLMERSELQKVKLEASGEMIEVEWTTETKLV